MDSSNNADALVRQVASSFAQNIANYGESPLEAWTQQATSYLESQNQSLTHEEAFDLALQALDIAKKQPQSALIQAKTNSQSFSLLGTGLLSIMSWEEIQQSENNREKLRLLQNVQYVDDMLPDWNDVKIYIAELLKDKELARDASALHRKWFGLTRCLQDYQAVQVGLLTNILDCISDILSQKEKIEYLPDLIALLHEMWMDWMQNSVFLEPARSIGHRIWNNMLKPHKDRPSAFLRTWTAIDPNARWFQSWAAHMTVLEILELTSDEYSILPVLVSRCEKHLQQKMKDPERDAMCWHFLAILHHILLTTRVSMFPWDVLADNEPSQSCDLFLNLFLESANDLDKQPIAIEALEALLPELLKKDRSSLKSISERLVSIHWKDSSIRTSVDHLLMQL